MAMHPVGGQAQAECEQCKYVGANAERRMDGLDDDWCHILSHLIGIFGNDAAAHGAGHQQTGPQAKIPVPRCEMVLAPSILVDKNAQEAKENDGAAGSLQLPMQSHTIDVR